MSSKQLACQNCDVKCNNVCGFKLHVSGMQHQKKVAELFQSDVYHGQVNIPFILVLDHLTKRPISTLQPIIGLSLVTFCLSSERSDAFYLCHVCEENCGPRNIIDHLNSADHLSNYYNYTDPDVLSFSWLNNSNNLNQLRVFADKELDSNGPGVLRMLDMPKSVVYDLRKSAYSKVMQALTHSERLEKCIRADRPERRTIQDYHRDSKRKHPLLGLQHLVEYCCEGRDQKKSYLCQLCQLSIPLHRVIKHTLSFDHVYWYFKAWHPSTLLTKDCYKVYSDRFKSNMQDLANQAQDISRSTNNEIQRVVLELEAFSSMPSVYREAVRVLESIREERHEGCLKISVTPGDKLVPFSDRPEATTRTVAKAAAGDVRLDEELSPEKSSIVPVEKQGEATATAAPTLTTARGHKGVCQLRCQNCNMEYALVSVFKLHIRSWKHKMMLGDGPGHLPSFILYEYMRNPCRTKPIIGVHLITTCLNAECVDIPVCLCHVCQESFPSTCVLSHVTSAAHLQRTLMYQGPERLPFGWRPAIDWKVLINLAWEEETDRGENDMILKVSFCPDSVFSNIKKFHYFTAFQCLKDFHGSCFVDKPLTIWSHRKNPNRKYPLLGLQFLVQFSVARAWDLFPGWGFLCLLCKKKFSDELVVAHVNSHAHVTKFLKRAHPGSLEQVSGSDERSSELLLDLAQQAEKAHAPGCVQVVKLEHCIAESVMYKKALAILKAVKRRKGLGVRIPLLPPGKKLVPFRRIRDQSLTTVGQDKETRNKNGNEIKNYKEAIPETLNMTGVKVEKQIGKAPCSDPRTMTDKEPCSDPSTMTDKEPCSDPSTMTDKEPCSHPSTMTDKEPCSHPSMMTGKEPCSHPSTMTDKEPCSDPSTMTGKEPCSDPGTKAGEEPCSDPETQLPRSPLSTTLCDFLKSKKRPPVIGLGVLIECRSDDLPLIYLCQVCQCVVLQGDVVSHITGDDHRRFFLWSMNVIHKLDRSCTLRKSALELEKSLGCGEAKVAEVKAHTHHLVSKNSIPFDRKVKMVLSGLRSPQRLFRRKPQKPQLKKNKEAKTLAPICRDAPAGRFPALWRYLQQPNRQPVIGVDMLTELKERDGDYVLCGCCSHKMFTSSVPAHVISSRHRYYYIKLVRPEMAADWPASPALAEKNGPLQRELRVRAAELEVQERTRHSQVVKEIPATPGDGSSTCIEG